MNVAEVAENWTLCLEVGNFSVLETRITPQMWQVAWGHLCRRICPVAWWWAGPWPAPPGVWPGGHCWTLAQVDIEAWPAPEPWGTHRTDCTLGTI